ncbi:uncharacterized protein NPIL_244141 [Nephila pilipes]|uniref:Uncharacterized protein n=1 Tax=Nephila pilipes TaxID=299642 RepID=A0A8X6QU41_NEPPI|nr:uncharacterized protein NPIL_244141 [Nephila pilipes]
MFYTLAISLYRISIGQAQIVITVAFMLANVFVTALWHAVNRRKWALRNLLTDCHKVMFMMNKKCKNNNMFMNLCIILSIMIPSVLAAMCAIFLHKAPVNYQQYYSFFLSYDSYSSYTVLLWNINTQITFLCMFSFPSCISIVCCVAYYKSCKVFKGFSDVVADIHQGVLNRYKVSKWMNMHRLLYELAHATEKALSPISLLLFSSQCLFMYITLANYIIFQIKDRYSTIIWHTLSSSLLSPASVIGVIVCASEISEEIRFIRTNLQLLYNTWVNESDADNKILLLMRTMIATKFPEMTAGNIMDLKLGLIFFHFGS